MWIKNQNRTLLANTDMVFAGDNEESNIVYCNNGNNQVQLGEYKDTDRALEVLDTIADGLEDGMDFVEDVEGQVFTRYIIFEMPVM
ncbi:MAG: hypothetical protein ACRDDM_03935 [Paraclostridium sp.]